tara:strand:+ start:282 stop:1082 length:801 start_codon:yes stop_codon:yes gene_type:complete
MRTLVLATVAALAATSALAEKETVAAALPITFSVEVDVTENQTTDKYEATTTLGVDFASDNTAAFGGFNFDSIDGGNLTLDEYYIGTTVGKVTLSYGDQGGLMPTAIADAGFDALSDPNAAMTESLQVSAMGASIAVGLTDVTTDITDISNVQAAYTFSLPAVDVTAAVDFNNTTDKYIWGGRAVASVSTVAIGTTATYAADVLALEADATLLGFTAYLNGDENDWSENVGLAYTTDINGLALVADANYNIDAKEVTPSVNFSFKF